MSNFFLGVGGVELLIPYRNPYNFGFSRGVQLFPGGGGSNCLFPIETHITFNFLGGSGPPAPPPPPPLDPHLAAIYLASQSAK